jgi:hypothetical protein
MEIFSEQVGGHLNAIKIKDDKIYKKTKNSEIEFYEYLYSPNCHSSLLPLKNFLPKFYGKEIIDSEKYIILENLHLGYLNANLLDCKLGKITYKKNYPEEKIQNQIKKFLKSTAKDFGFRITGLLYRDDLGNITEKLYKEQADTLINKENIYDYFNRLMNFNKKTIEDLIIQCEEILNFFKNQTIKSFLASSFYFIVGKNDKCQVRFIDMSTPIDLEGNFDANIIEGIEGVIDILKKIMNI